VDHKQVLASLKEISDKRLNNFKIQEVESINAIRDDAYLENPTWLGGDREFVCLFIDLDQSSKLSFKKHPQTMAKIYDYFTQNIVNVMTDYPEFKADYIDIKGDGAFGIYEGKNAAQRAFCAAVTFKTFFDKHIRPKFQTESEIINCKLAISKDKILVKKIGKRGDRNNNEVWAGRVVNNASKLSSLTKDMYEAPGAAFIFPAAHSLLVISEKIYNDLSVQPQKAIMSCGHDEAGNNCPSQSVWQVFDTSSNQDVFDDKVYFMAARWCQHCGDKSINELVKI
jgi:class 3 adenylate cyclase